MSVLRQAFQRWLLGRLPAADTWLLTQRNIYIVPTRAGFAFAATLLLMLVAAINYQLNLGYVLTFLLAGAGLVSMHLTHATLRGLTLHLRPPAPVHAGESAAIDLVLDNRGRTRHGLAVHLQGQREHGRDGSAFAWCDVPAYGQEVARIAIVPARRGWHDLPLIVVETVFPFGLFRAWAVWRPAARLLAWPRPEQPAPALPQPSAAAGERTSRRPERGSDLDGVRAYRRGDTPRAIVWKKVARSGQLVSRETSAAGSRELWLDWSATPATDPEQRASRLAAWVLAAERAGLEYGLRLPGRNLEPGQGDAQRRAALDLLATQ
ncbi:MAG: DUF58 domain-containing protein [Burkholderiales bacterium]|nr:DUF58 domain-containing protein [Burkholderiales bacterium]